MRHVDDDAADGKGAMLVKIAVETHNFMARPEQHRHHDSTDIAQVPSDQHAHDCFFLAIPAVSSPIQIIAALARGLIPPSWPPWRKLLKPPWRAARACGPARPCLPAPLCPSR